MVLQINRGNLVTVMIASPANATLRVLGYQEEQTDTNERPYKKQVPGDYFAGSDGPPIDVQFTGITVDIRMRLSKYDPVVASEIEAVLGDGSTAGLVPESNIGKLLFQDGTYFRVALVCTKMPRNFPRCEVIDAVEVNRGTKFATFICTLKAHVDQDTDVLWDANIS